MVYRMLFVCVLLVIQSCAVSPSHVRISPGFIHSLEQGVTTRDEIENSLGMPIRSLSLGDGKSLLTYHFIYEPEVSGYIPEAERIAAGTDKQMQILNIFLDAHGRVEQVRFGNRNGTVYTELFPGNSKG